VFDRATQHRRAMLAKINIARHQLAMAEDDYRQLLLDTTGKLSLKECSDAQLDAMIAKLKSKGFTPLPSPGRAPRPDQKARLVPAAQHPMARKARALWISLYHLGVVHNPAEEALEAFAKRQLGCERFSWARQSEGYRLIEALKAMAERAGWRQRGLDGKPLAPLTLASHLCQVILGRLGESASPTRNGRWKPPPSGYAARRSAAVREVGRGWPVRGRALPPPGRGARRQAARGGAARGDRRGRRVMSGPDLKMALHIVDISGLAPLARSWNTRPKNHFGSGGHYSRWVLADRDVQKLVVAKLEEHGAEITFGDQVRINFAGITVATSMGLRRALDLWSGKARRALPQRKSRR
jgi:phage gp16-like protein